MSVGRDLLWHKLGWLSSMMGGETLKHAAHTPKKMLTETACRKKALFGTHGRQAVIPPLWGTHWGKTSSWPWKPEALIHLSADENVRTKQWQHLAAFLLFLFCSILDHSVWDGASHMQGTSSLSVNPLWQHHLPNPHHPTTPNICLTNSVVISSFRPVNSHY